MLGQNIRSAFLPPMPVVQPRQPAPPVSFGPVPGPPPPLPQQQPQGGGSGGLDANMMMQIMKFFGGGA